MQHTATPWSGGVGTSGTVFAFSGNPVIDPQGEVAAFCDSTDRWLPLACTMNVTVATEQIRKLFGWSHEELERLERGLYVTDLNGNRCTFGRTSARFAAGQLISSIPYVGGMYFFVDCLCVAFTLRKQAIHDMISGCLVMRKS